jgi:hypothetical protein
MPEWLEMKYRPGIMPVNVKNNEIGHIRQLIFLFTIIIERAKNQLF